MELRKMTKTHRKVKATFQYIDEDNRHVYAMYIVMYRDMCGRPSTFLLYRFRAELPGGRFGRETERYIQQDGIPAYRLAGPEHIGAGIVQNLAMVLLQD